MVNMSKDWKTGVQRDYTHMHGISSSRAELHHTYLELVERVFANEGHAIVVIALKPNRIGGALEVWNQAIVAA